MSTKLITHLKKKCEEDGNVAILFAQWEFDQKLVSKALENIGGYYPHFSNHNASHSQQILVNIERVLGQDVDLLGATDTWLILEAAYWHDVGMLVDAKNAKEVHTNPDFNFMIQTIANEKGHDLQKFCQAYVEKNWLSAIGTVDHPFDGIEQYRQLVAEWFRRGHDKRVGKIVEDPFKDLGITSPRTELLPNRIYRYLGQICVSHGMNFDVLMEALPYKQTGLGTEDCHPRFIGCLLRLGDLFDLDDNRFCPVMAKHVSNMPSVSQHHKDKHLSLREFQLDKRTVKLIAECPNEMAYVETQKWFSWIREEFQNQMSQWNLIVPNQEFGSLPTIEQLEVRMQGNRVLLDNKPMKFSIDDDNAVEILEGSGLYKNDTNTYRELIQNAIDATLMRVWIEHSNHTNPADQLPRISHPYEEKTREILSKYPILIDFKKIEDLKDSDDSLWEFILKDNGVGITLKDLSYMQKIAGSSRNTERQKIIAEMQKWMRPSGQFGIGLHSAFLLMKDLPDNEQKITLITKNIHTNKSYEIEMYSPQCRNNGYCFIKELDNTHISMWGTTLKFKIKVNRRGQKYRSNPSLLHQYLEKNYDPLLEETFDTLILATQVDEIYTEVITDSPIQCNFGDFWQQSLNKLYQSDLERRQKEDAWLWLEKEQLYFHVSTKAETLSAFSGTWYAWFKGQPVDRLRSGIYDLFDFNIIFYGLEAKTSLNVDRKGWKNKFTSKLRNESFFENLCFYVLENHLNELKNMLGNDSKVSLFSYYFDPDNKLKNIDQQLWRDMKLLSKKIAYKNYNEQCKLYDSTFNELLELNNFSLVYARATSKIDNSFDDNTIVTHSYDHLWAFNEFDKCWHQKGGMISIENESGFRKKVYSRNELQESDNYEIISDMKDFLKHPSKRKFYNDWWLELDFFKKFKPLFIISPLTERLVGLQKDKKMMILPLIFEWDTATDEEITNFKNSTKNLNIRVDSLQLISEDAWNARCDEFEQMTQKEFEDLFHELLADLDDLLKNETLWTNVKHKRA